MSTAKRLALIAAGYAIAFAGGLAAVALNELRMSEDIAQGSPGMVAFGDMILFIFCTGALGLLPTWFLLRLCVEKVPRTLLTVELLLAVMGPLSWLAMVGLARAGPNLPDQPQTIGQLFGLFVAFAAIPRIVLGPVLLVIEAATMFMMRQRMARVLLAAAMLMDLVPIGMYVAYMARSIR